MDFVNPLEFIKAVRLYLAVTGDSGAYTGWEELVALYEKTGVINEEDHEHMDHVWHNTSRNLSTWYNPKHPVYQKERLELYRENQETVIPESEWVDEYQNEEEGS